jgi:choloylglycine hydrolase
MCTAISYKNGGSYFGRTLDIEKSFGESVTITPRLFPLRFNDMGIMGAHYAFIGMAHVLKGYPLYYDAVNEKGLGIAALNFTQNAHYRPREDNKENISYFELIPWLLCQCATVAEAKARLERLNITHTPFSKDLPVSELHWLVADREQSITVEAVEEGIKIYDNPTGILTNNPPFPQQMFYLNNYMSISAKTPKNTFAKQLALKTYSRGMGALGLPGDLSSSSRFVRAVFTKSNSSSPKTENDNLSQFFHICDAVSHTRGCCLTEKGESQITIYSSCCNQDKGIYYYQTYNNRQITAVNMFGENLDSKELISFPLIQTQQINRQN